MNNDLYIVGSGGYAVDVAEIASILGYNVVGFIDDNPDMTGKTILNWQVIGGSERIPDGSSIALGIGNNSRRNELIKQVEAHKWVFPTLVHPSAVISHNAMIESGSVIMPQAVVSSRVIVNCGCILDIACSLAHDCVIGDAVHICAGTRLAGYVTVDSFTMLGIGSSVRQGIHIGSGCIIGAGAVVVSDVCDGITVVGNPARELVR